MLKDFFMKNSEVAIAFSGGVDSSYLLYQAVKYAKKVKAYYVKTAFQPQFELMDAKKIADELNAEMEIIEADILSYPEISENDEKRCYYCKKTMIGLIIQKASEDGFSILLDGTNASDDEKQRPGMKALRELNVLSPLKSEGLFKEDVRRLSKEAGLFTWNKPAYACLATRIKTGERINPDKLLRTERAEEFMTGLGLRDFRIRSCYDDAILEVTKESIPIILRYRKEIIEELSKEYSKVYLNLEVRDE